MRIYYRSRISIYAIERDEYNEEIDCDELQEVLYYHCQNNSDQLRTLIVGYYYDQLTDEKKNTIRIPDKSYISWILDASEKKGTSKFTSGKSLNIFLIRINDIISYSLTTVTVNEFGK